jgi:hypothetical protein
LSGCRSRMRRARFTLPHVSLERRQSDDDRSRGGCSTAALASRKDARVWSEPKRRWQDEERRRQEGLACPRHRGPKDEK